MEGEKEEKTREGRERMESWKNSGKKGEMEE